MARIPVAILAATGAVGQRFVQLLADHPWFEIAAVTGSARTAGERYGDNVRWILTDPMPASVADLVVQPTAPNLDVPVVFSALPTAEAREFEPQFAAAGYAVVTNASAYRMAEDVPLLIPEINPDHTALIPAQQRNCGWPGFIVASPNCSTSSIVLPLHIFHQAFGLEAALITTMQAISGAGYPGVSGMDILDNIVPHIPGEDEKLEQEPKKLLGQLEGGTLALADLRLSAEATRVPVRDGHLALVSVLLREQATPQEAIDALCAWQPPAIAANLPSSPERTLVYHPEPDRPQPRLDRANEQGLAWTVGNVRACDVLDLRYMALTHNTLRGAASGSILNAELLVAQGYIDRV
ncbi:MAG: aspartate-semialdehyde dehydrogenase [Anaerolineae bacterium]|nr:aspartate-semialdehyde dehydrogenase [Anaerolineae bacterium]